MFSTSLDILNLVIAICLVVLTTFLCFALYYFTASLRKINLVAKKAEQGINKLQELIELVRAKFKSGSTYLMVMAELAKKAMDMVKEKNAAKRTGSQKKK